jgi:hypothetical protein
MSAKFITDLGASQDMFDATGKKVFELPRYGVWGDKGRGKAEVLETHNDLARMQREHGVPDERVVAIKSMSGFKTQA